MDIFSFFKKQKPDIKAKVLVAGYPRSGNSWFNYMLANLLGAKWMDIHKPDARHNDPEIRRRTGWGEKPLDHSSRYEYVIKSHQRRDQIKNIQDYSRIIYLVRDPRDVLVSYFFFTNIHEAQLLKKDKLDLNDSLLMNQKMEEMIRKVATEWKEHYQSWSNTERHTIKYRELLNDTHSELMKACKFLGYSPTNELIEDVVNFYKFENMSGGRKQGQEDVEKFVRKGIVGDYKNHLSLEQIQYVQEICGQEMLALGYELL